MVLLSAFYDGVIRVPPHVLCCTYGGAMQFIRALIASLYSRYVIPLPRFSTIFLKALSHYVTRYLILISSQPVGTPLISTREFLAPRKCSTFPAASSGMSCPKPISSVISGVITITGRKIHYAFQLVHDRMPFVRNLIVIWRPFRRLRLDLRGFVLTSR